MGYTTKFTGAFRVDPPLAPERVRYLQRFNETRRMKRSVEALQTMPDPIREAVGLPLGPDGAYFVGSDDPYGQDMDHPSVADANEPPSGQHGLWCGWRPSDDGSTIAWDGAEKFYSYAEWLQYLVDHFLQPWGHTLSGEVRWQGEERGDTGTLCAGDRGVFADPDW